MKTAHFTTIILFTLLIIFSSCSQPKPKDPVNTDANIPVAMFLSDFHIGENYGGVSREVPAGKTEEYDSVPGIADMYFHKKVTEMMHIIDSTAARNDSQNIPYLILLGDIFDVAVHEASDAFNLAHTFFNAPIYNNRSFISFFDTIIYLPGNHDHHVWRMLQEEFYISERLQQGMQALPFPHKGISILNLSGTTSLQPLDESLIDNKAGKNFMSYLLSDNQKAVQVSYPNLYIRYKDGEENSGICVTHGHFFEPNWNKDTALVQFFPDVNKMPDYFRNVEKYNSPFTELADYSIAQVNEHFTNELSDVAFQDPSSSTAREYGKAALYLARQYPSFFPLDTVSTPLTDIEKLQRHPRQVFPYMQHAQREMAEHNMIFEQLIYGHTHVPCFNRTSQFGDFSDETSTADKGWLEKEVVIHNTGGWVNIQNTDNISLDNATHKAPNPMFLYKNGDIAKVFP